MAKPTEKFLTPRGFDAGALMVFGGAVLAGKLTTRSVEPRGLMRGAFESFG